MMRIAVCLLLLAALPSGRAWAQGIGRIQTGLGDANPLNGQPPVPVIGKGTIAGVVIDSKTHEPIKKAHVALNGAAQVQLSAVTDASGSFAFHALPPGPYFLMGNHESYSTNPGNAAQTLTLAEDEEKRDVQIRLNPGANISGRVVDEDDEPIANCFVLAARSDRSHPERRMTLGENTDAQGRYRIRGIPPGRFVVSAHCRETFPAPHGFMRRNDPLTPQEGYASQVRPDALPAGAGADLTGIDFHVKRVPLFVVRGTVSGPRPDLMRAVQISLHPDGAEPDDEMSVPVRYSATSPEFTFRGVPAGSYELSATIFEGDHPYEARQNLEAGKTFVTQADLKLMPGPALSGSIETDDPNTATEGLQITLMPISQRYRGPFPMATVGKDGTFEFKNLLPGKFRLNGLPFGYIKSVTLGGQELAAENIEIPAQAPGPLHISVGAKMGSVEAVFETTPKAGDFVTAFLVPASGSQPLLQVNDGSSPGIVFGAVPPGKYRVFLLPGQGLFSLMNDPEIFKSLESRSVPIEVHEGGNEKVAVGLVPAADLEKAIETAE